MSYRILIELGNWLSYIILRELQDTYWAINNWLSYRTLT